jgi:hypothetical protein
LGLTSTRLHLSRAADLEHASAAQPATAVVVHPPPADQSPTNGAKADDDDEEPVKNGNTNSDNSAADRSSFSLFGMLTRWNKEGDDSLRLQQFQEQVCGSFPSRLDLVFVACVHGSLFSFGARAGFVSK